jgi:thymidylate kinase
MNRGLWVSIDGTDGVGKTFLGNLLMAKLDGVILAPEFSDSENGRYLCEIVKEKPHFISSSIVEQSLLFLADFFRIYETIIRKMVLSGNVVISDRGYVSKYIYQLIILSTKYGMIESTRILNALFDLLPVPDITVFLTCNRDVQVNRLLIRDGHCDNDRIVFMQQAEIEIENFLNGNKFNHIKIQQFGAESSSNYQNEALNLVLDCIDKLRS